VESQLKQFPRGRLLDIIDSFSMHIRMYKSYQKETSKKDVPPLSEYSWDTVMKELKKRPTNNLQNGVSSNVSFYEYSLTSGVRQ
jgi:hypothetical protein